MWLKEVGTSNERNIECSYQRWALPIKETLTVIEKGGNFKRTKERNIECHCQRWALHRKETHRLLWKEGGLTKERNIDCN